MIETNKHLFCSPQYSKWNKAGWSSDFMRVAKESGSLTWDPAGLLSFVTHGYACGNQTMFQEVRRQPWLSEIVESKEVVLFDVPQHGFIKMAGSEIGKRLLVLLENEAEKACRDRTDVYILTSGGLDSRIIAGVLKRLLDQRRIDTKVHAVTWGRDGSRDVEIGKQVAESLGFEWTHLCLGADHFEQNIFDVADHLGSLVSPIHLHRMTWFRDLPAGGLVLAGSYGDSVGRGEFSGKTVLELRKLGCLNRFDLLNSSVVDAGTRRLKKEWEVFRQRLGSRPEYAKLECEQQSHYMRGMIAQAMSIIAGPCDLYQMFTAPEVFSFMWSIHPSFRDNKPYSTVLQLIGYDLDRFPWARNNKPLGSRSGIRVDAKHEQYHDYPAWSREIIESKFQHEEHRQWLSKTGVFNENGIANALAELERPSTRSNLNKAASLLIWTLSLRRMCQRTGSEIKANFPKVNSPSSPKKRRRVGLLSRMKDSPALVKIVQQVRGFSLKLKARYQFPPLTPPDDLS